jgi:RNA polymerase sigma-32 factor
MCTIEIRLVQQGNLGLLIAARRFDPNRNCRLATYAAYWIRAEILSFMTRTLSIVRMNAAGSNSEFAGGDAAGAVSLADGAESPAPETKTRWRTSRAISLDDTPEDKLALIERLTDDSPLPDEQYIERNVRSTVHDCVASAISKLSEEEAIVVRGRWLCEEQVTLAELAATIGTSCEQVRRIEERAQRRLQSYLPPWASLVA